MWKQRKQQIDARFKALDTSEREELDIGPESLIFCKKKCNGRKYALIDTYSSPPEHTRSSLSYKYRVHHLWDYVVKGGKHEYTQLIVLGYLLSTGTLHAHACMQSFVKSDKYYSKTSSVLNFSYFVFHPFPTHPYSAIGEKQRQISKLKDLQHHHWSPTRTIVVSMYFLRV